MTSIALPFRLLPPVPTAPLADLPRLTRNSFTYAGAFRVPMPTSQISTYEYGGNCLQYSATNNSLFMRGHSWYQQMGEISIPTLVVSPSMSSLNRAEIIQPLTDVLAGKRGSVDVGTGQVWMGGVLPIGGGDMIATAWVYYDAGGQQTLSHFKTLSNFSAIVPSSVSGPYKCGTAGAGFVAGYMLPIPAEWQAALGGAYFTGLNGVPIISRTSCGPALSVFDPTDVGSVNPIPAEQLLGYPIAHPTLGAWNSSGTLFNAACDIPGGAILDGTRTAIFFGRKGLTATFCYGAGTPDASLNLQPVPWAPGQVFCYDPAYNTEGTHDYPYTYYAWAYDLIDLKRVHDGLINPWDIQPYSTWAFDLPYQTDSRLTTGMTFDPATRRLYVGGAGQDGAMPIVHVFNVAST